MIMGICLLCAACGNKGKITYPEAERQDVTDNYFGHEVADPYRWMENDTTAQVAAWVEAENRVTDAYLQKIPFLKSLNRRLTALADYEKMGMPFKKGGKYYFFRNDGLQNQSVLYVMDSAEMEAPDALQRMQKAEVFLDPNKLSDDGTVALTGVYFNKTGTKMAYTISRSGSDWSEIYVMDVQSRQLTGDHIIWAKFTGAAWHGDGFYYSGYPQPKEGSELSGINEGHRVYYHNLGTPQSEDRRITIELDRRHPQRFYTAATDEDEQWLIIDEDGADNGNRVFVKNFNWKYCYDVSLAEDFRYRHQVVACIGQTVYMLTNEDAPNYRLVKIDLSAMERIPFGQKGGCPLITKTQYVDVIPENNAVLSNVQLIGGKWVAIYGQDASDHAYIFSMEGKKEREIQLPTFGPVSFSGEKKERGCFYTFTSFTFPAVIYRLDVETGESVKFRTPQVAFNPEDYICEQLFVTSKDGTKVPMFITYKKGLQRNGKNPVYLYGYGGFNISLTPGFSPYRIPFLEAGGIYASVNLRGGSEYGEAWHLAGTKMQKQNVFDDCIAAAEHLIKEKYTKAGKICIAGGSNGGLLVGAVVNQRPDLFGAALPAVGVMDMLRYHLFTIGWNWAPDYGTSADSEEMFKYLYAYSPLHNIRNDGTPYPPILITTADHDDRVVPAHSFKYAATLQASNTGNAPKLIMIETKAGHGAGKPLSKVLESQTATWGFAMYELGMQPKWK